MLNGLKNYTVIFCFLGIFPSSIATEISDDSLMLRDTEIALVKTRLLLASYTSYMNWVNEPIFDRFLSDARTKGKGIVVKQTWEKIVEISKDLFIKYKISEIDSNAPLFCTSLHKVFLNRENRDCCKQEKILKELFFSSDNEIESDDLLGIIERLLR